MLRYLLFGIFTVFVSLLLACHPRSKRTLSGEWRWLEPRENNLSDADTSDSPPAISSVSHEFPGLRFLSVDSLENPMGFFNYDVNAQDTGKPKISYIGSRTAYKCSGDSLFIFDRSIKKWKSYVILRKDTDTLVLKDERGVLAWYANVVAQPQYDAISIASSGCFGSCPVTKILFFNNGRVLSYAEQYTKGIGFLEARIDTALYKDIVRRFNKASIMHLRARYEASHTDDNTITVSFVRNGRIVKTISDYGKKAPAEFIWAYQHALNNSSIIKYKPIKPPFSPVLSGYLEDKRGTWPEILSLYPSESFLLWYYLTNGKITSARSSKLPYKFEINANYKVKWPSGRSNKDSTFINIANEKTFALQTFSTDGRYVQLVSTKYDAVWIDLGFNFIERNNILRWRFLKSNSTDTERYFILENF